MRRSDLSDTKDRTERTGARSVEDWSALTRSACHSLVPKRDGTFWNGALTNTISLVDETPDRAIEARRPVASRTSSGARRTVASFVAVDESLVLASLLRVKTCEPRPVPSR